MKFKQNEEPEKIEISEKLKEGFIELIQFEIEKLSFIDSAKRYFDKNGLTDESRFFSDTFKSCKVFIRNLINFVSENGVDFPEFTVPATITFTDKKEPFEKLVKFEDGFEKGITALIDIAFEDKNWKIFIYLLRTLDCMDHIACKTLGAIENGGNINSLCKQHFLER